jgi:transposase
MATTSNAPSRFVGCDVGKAFVVVFDTAAGQVQTIPNRAPDLRRFARTLRPDCLVVCEATGGYEARLLDAMLAAGVPCHRADARKVKAFIRSFGTLGKSDAIDAQALARYGAERHGTLPRWQPPDPDREELQSLVLTRIDLVRMRQAQANRLAAPGAKPVAGVLRAVLREITVQLRAIDARIAGLMRRHPVLTRQATVLHGIRGVGAVTTATLLALMPELGQLSGKQAAALAGVAPHPHESGQRLGYRRTRGGRPEVKRSLFMAALTASRGKGRLAEAYQRLVARGKKPIVAITAIMRKLVVIANAKLRDEARGAVPQLS